MNGFLAEEGTPGVPPNGYFYNAPFRDSCVDDYISRRGLEKLSGEMLGVPLDGRALAERIAAGDERAKACFRCFGEQLCDALQPQIEAFCPDTLCMGDRLWKARHYFCTRWKNFVQTRRLLYILHRILLCGLCRG